jgi:FMN-dependent NADH-azoreductase
MNLLHIDSSIQGDKSVSRQLSAAIVAQWRADHPAIAITRRDLDRDPVPAMNSASLAAAFDPTGGGDPALQPVLSAQSAALEEFLAADIVVIGAPMYNFAIPGALKHWLDSLAVPGKTFAYTAEGPRGLAGGKKIVIASARGNFYTGDRASMDFQEPYLRTMLNFFGVTDIDIVRAEGVAVSPEHRQRALDTALGSIAGIDRTWRAAS